MTAPAVSKGTRPVSSATWFAARARNAARRVLLIVSIGSAVVIAAMLLLVLVPREVNRAIRQEIEALPSLRDTLTLAATVDSLRGEQERAERALQSARRADSIAVVLLAQEAARRAAAESLRVANLGFGVQPVRDLPRDAERADLAQRLTRARTSPLIESFRELAQSPLMRADPRVQPLVDTLQQLDREREAFAALGGLDARYAALSARISALGQRLIRIGEAHAASGSSADTVQQADVPEERRLPQRRDPEELQALAAATAAAQQEVVRAQQAVEDAIEWNQSIEARRNEVRSRANIRIPPVALFVAPLVLGLVAGFTGAIVVEIRIPRVADAYEAERLARARVVVHAPESEGSALNRARRRADRALPPALSSTGESFQLLHLTLTGVGEVARRVRIVADSPILAASVAANLAAAAVRDARAVLLVDLDVRHRHLAELLRVDSRLGMTDVLSGEAEVLEVVRDFAVGRDVYMTVLYGGRRAARGSSERRMVVHEDLDRLSSRYDLTVIVSDEDPAQHHALLPATDVILCVKASETPVVWLARSAQQVRAEGHRLRAVLLWSANASVA